MSGQNDTGQHFGTAGEDLADHRLVRHDANGDLVYCDAGEYPLGTVHRNVLDTYPATYEKLVGKTGSVKMTAVKAIAQYEQVYTADDGKISDAPNAVFLGIAVEAASGDGSIIEVLPDPKMKPYANVASSAEVEETTVETAFDKTFTIPAGSLKAGDVIKIRASGLVNDNNSTDTLNIKLYLGTVEIAATGAVDVEDADVFVIDALAVVRTVGATGTVVATGFTALDAANVTCKAFNKASQTLATNADISVNVKATWSVSHADNEVQLDILAVELPGQTYHLAT